MDANRINVFILKIRKMKKVALFLNFGLKNIDHLKLSALCN